VRFVTLLKDESVIGSHSWVDERRIDIKRHKNNGRARRRQYQGMAVRVQSVQNAAAHQRSSIMLRFESQLQ